jgi:hypothetical protein
VSLSPILIILFFSSRFPPFALFPRYHSLSLFLHLSTLFCFLSRIHSCFLSSFLACLSNSSCYLLILPSFLAFIPVFSPLSLFVSLIISVLFWFFLHSFLSRIHSCFLSSFLVCLSNYFCSLLILPSFLPFSHSFLLSLLFPCLSL